MSRYPEDPDDCLASPRFQSIEKNEDSNCVPKLTGKFQSVFDGTFVCPYDMLHVDAVYRLFHDKFCLQHIQPESIAAAKPDAKYELYPMGNRRYVVRRCGFPGYWPRDAIVLNTDIRLPDNEYNVPEDPAVIRELFEPEFRTPALEDKIRKYIRDAHKDADLTFEGAVLMRWRHFNTKEHLTLPRKFIQSLLREVLNSMRPSQ